MAMTMSAEELMKYKDSVEERIRDQGSLNSAHPESVMSVCRELNLPIDVKDRRDDFKSALCKLDGLPVKQTLCDLADAIYEFSYPAKMFELKLGYHTGKLEHARSRWDYCGGIKEVDGKLEFECADDDMIAANLRGLDSRSLLADMELAFTDYLRVYCKLFEYIHSEINPLYERVGVFVTECSYDDLNTESKLTELQQLVDNLNMLLEPAREDSVKIKEAHHSFGNALNAFNQVL
jgi:hypothetical protein